MDSHAENALLAAALDEALAPVGTQSRDEIAPALEVRPARTSCSKTTKRMSVGVGPRNRGNHVPRCAPSPSLCHNTISSAAATENERSSASQLDMSTVLDGDATCAASADVLRRRHGENAALPHSGDADARTDYDDDAQQDMLYSGDNVDEEQSGAAALSNEFASADAASCADASDARYDESLPDGGTVRRRRLSHDVTDEVPNSDKDATLAAGYKEEGNRHFAAAEYDTAAAAYTEALRFVPSDPGHAATRAVYWSNRAACALHLEKLSAALYDCDRALEEAPAYVKALTRRATVLERLGKLDEAVKGV